MGRLCTGAQSPVASMQAGVEAGQAQPELAQFCQAPSVRSQVSWQRGPWPASMQSGLAEGQAHTAGSAHDSASPQSGCECRKGRGKVHLCYPVGLGGFGS